MKKSILLTLITIVLAGTATLLMATPPPPDPTVLPIDGGLSLLAAACIGFGAKKISEIKK